MSSTRLLDVREAGVVIDRASSKFGQLAKRREVSIGAVAAPNVDAQLLFRAVDRERLVELRLGLEQRRRLALLGGAAFGCWRLAVAQLPIANRRPRARED